MFTSDRGPFEVGRPENEDPTCPKQHVTPKRSMDEARRAKMQLPISSGYGTTSEKQKGESAQLCQAESGMSSLGTTKGKQIIASKGGPEPVPSAAQVRKGEVAQYHDRNEGERLASSVSRTGFRRRQEELDLEEAIRLSICDAEVHQMQLASAIPDEGRRIAKSSQSSPKEDFCKDDQEQLARGLSQTDLQAVRNLEEALGVDYHEALRAFVDADRNEDVAANNLISQFS
mmetsp:Transcript_107631/g.169941  ORF Transcript_107631/g.169941 Transcript_107631/m.169941 type:complete len:230 (-) Transcript_107631:9-698(-)